MKIVVVVAFLLAMALGRRLYVGWQLSLQKAPSSSPRVPAALLEGDRTWVVFTTPYCASCGPVKERLAADDPNATIVTVDATRQPHLADAFSVRSAPTVLLADGRGEVLARLVGAPAVRDYLSSVSETA